MPYSSNTIVASGLTANVSVPFGYIEQSDVNVTLNGTVVPQNTLVWTAPGTILLPSIPTAGTVIVVSRTTSATALDVQFQDPSVLQGTDLNTALLQLLYIAQEAYDLGNASNAELATITTYVNTAMASAAESATAAAGSASAAAASAAAAFVSQTTEATLAALVQSYSNSAAASAAAALLAVGPFTFQGSWDASAGTFPGSGTAAKASLWTVSVGGTVGGVVWTIGQDIIALKANPSTTVYATNWLQTPGTSGGTGVTSTQVDTALGFTPASNAITVTGAGLVTGGGDLTANRTLTVTAAVAADIVTGTDTTKALTAAALAGVIGTAAGNLVKLDGSAKLPAVDGSQLTNLPSAGGKQANSKVFLTSGTWTKPAGYGANSIVKISAWGGGGGGCSATTSSNLAGGAGGAYNEWWFPLSVLPSSLAIGVGAAGGGGGASLNQAGTAGGNTTVGSLFTVLGGAGGDIVGSGAPATIALSIGGVEAKPEWSGGAGALKTGPVPAGNAFYGGGGGGTVLAVTGGTSLAGGAGASSVSGTPSPGSFPGGGGATSSGGGSFAGGAGGGGQVIITVFDGA